MFGNNVNDKLGHVGYVCFYLAGGVFAGIGHSILHSNPVLGASGAVAAVTGAYLVLFPQSLITVLYWLFFIGTMELSALYFIAFKLIVWDNIVPRFSPASIAYDAHLAGYGFGIAAILLLLATGLITGSRFDLWSMIKQWNRRRRYRDVVSNGYSPYSGQPITKKIKAKEIKKAADPGKQDEKANQLRVEIASRIQQRNLAVAADLYLQLITHDDKQILPRQYLLDIANQLNSDGKYPQAARACEQFLSHYTGYEYAEQVELMLGILYARYLNNDKAAIKHLTIAAEKLADPDQIRMCREELAKLQS